MLGKKKSQPLQWRVGTVMIKNRQATTNSEPHPRRFY